MKLKKPILFFAAMFFALIAKSQTLTLTTQQYIDLYKNVAIEEMHRTGVPAAISLGQGIIESQSGNGWLVQHSNNHFGIKCKNNWTGKTISYDDDKKNECFRKYDSALDSWHDHSDFLKNNLRYNFLFQLNPEDYKAWAYGLKQAGYATNPQYSEKLINTIEEYNLEQYTKEGLQTVTFANASEKDSLVFASVDNTNPDGNKISNPTNLNTQEYPSGVFTINGKRVLFLPAGTSLLKIADDYHLKLRMLVSYNELPDDQLLSSPSLIFIERKSTTGADAYHIVSAGENMYTIAQEEGMQLKWLYKRNKMLDGEEAAPGEKLWLKGDAGVAPKLATTNDRPGDQKHFSPRQMIVKIRRDVNAVLGKTADTTSTDPQKIMVEK